MNKINKMGKRFVALVVVFASIMSFLPIQFGANGQAAKAVTTQIKVSGTGDPGDNVTIVDGEYTTKQPYENFTVAVDFKIVDDKNKIPIGQTGVIKQEVIITSIDGIKLNGATLGENNDKLDQIGVSISAGNTPYIDKSNNKTIGATITNLPYGVNIIEYRIKETTVYNKAVPSLGSDGKTIITTGELQSEVEEYFPSPATSEKIVIQHANKFVQGKVDPMVFDAYAGDTINVYNATKDNQLNKGPFLYSEEQESNSDCPLRYNFNVSDAIQTLKYTMVFKGIGLGDTTVFKNGTNDTTNIDKDVANNSISGYLTNLGSSDLIVAKIRDTGTNVVKTYAIQLKYTTLSSSEDYTLRDAGITKYNYDSDSNVKAYIGKKFITTTENGVSIHKGTITIDKLADMINMKPTLGRSSSETVFKISNHYDGAILPPQTGGDGKQYINFHKGTSNVLWLEVWEGKDGNVTGKQLARYEFKVILGGDTTDDSIVDFNFETPAYLTQPGRTGTEEAIPFSSDRRTYDLHSEIDPVTVKLTKPSSTHSEYIRAWGGYSVESDSVTEIADLDKKDTVTFDTKDYKKIILQAYYDEIVYKKDSSGNIEYKDGKAVIESQTPYPIGQKYIFYVAKNAGTLDPSTGTSSSDATLSSIKASNGTVKSADNINYSVKVPKIDTSSAITVTTNSDKVKDISATIVETEDEYGLTSGESFDFPLNASGTTNIKVVVTAEDGINVSTYYLTITNDSRGANALLKNVVTDNGDFTFNPDASVNKIRVDQIIKKLKVAPIAVDSKSKITVNGVKYSGIPVTIDLAGSQKTDMTITVTSEDGSDSKTYYFEIYRTDADLQNSDENTNKDDVFYDDIDDCWVDTSKYEEWGIIKGKDIYFDKRGRQVKEQWISTKNIWYYLNSEGYKATGWRKDVGGKSYYLDPSTGELKKGWMNINNKIYYLGLNGVMQKGWLCLNNKWYYFTPEGEMVISQSMFIDDKVYNFGQDGAIY